MEIDASELGSSAKKLSKLFQQIQALASETRTGKQGLFTIVINYFEDFRGQNEDNVRAFFRDLNGMLRTNPMLIIWPVTQETEAKNMLELASAVSSTIFADEPILRFMGPALEKFPAITKRTISTLNPGMSFEDFQLTEDDFDQLLVLLKQQQQHEQTIRDYLQSTRTEWELRGNHVEKIISSIPKFTEVWFVVCYPEAERVVSQFARKHTESDWAWDGDIRKFSEYISGDTQKAADWDQKRLMQALQGCFKTKILFLPTHALVSCVAAYGKDASESGRSPVQANLLEQVMANLPRKNWENKSAARRFMATSPIARQLRSEGALPGERRGKNTSLESANEAFLKINQAISSGGEGSDQPINRCLALCLRETVGIDSSQVLAEEGHPWLPNIRPDILIKKPDKIICIEVQYTADKSPHVLANYVLKKMDRYMRQLDAYLRAPQFRFE